MRILPVARRVTVFSALFSVVFIAACGTIPSSSRNSLACMARVMYFESIRSSDEGMLAVGTVVMNRVDSKEFPNTVCGVVGQKNQFAPGVLSRPMKEDKSKERAVRVARAVLSGKRHRGVGHAKYFHTAGRTYRYKNMHYVLVAGGNAFYTRDPKAGRRYIPRRQIARAGPTDSIVAGHRWWRPRFTDGERRIAAAPSRSAPTPTRAAHPVALAAVPAAPPAEATIEQLIIANAGW